MRNMGGVFGGGECDYCMEGGKGLGDGGDVIGGCGGGGGDNGGRLVTEF